ncbi:MAG: DUF4340 domain-containing protein [Clostridia bacterium]|nr:DUF4340 domain-containing protein [Clostridia bacterium]
MSSFEEEKIDIVEEEESTIFATSPTKTQQKKPKKKKGSAAKIIALAAAMLIICGSIFAVIKLVPKKNDTIEVENIPVTSIAPEKIKQVTLTRKESVSTYLSTLTETTDENGEKVTEIKWRIDGIDPSFTETTMISQMLDSAFSLYATRTIEREEGADYGFSAPQYKIEMKGYSSEDDKTLIIGSETPSHSGVYATVDDKIYLISIETAADFAATDESMATSFAIAGATVDGETMDYFVDDKLASFDKITLSGKNFAHTLQFITNESEDGGNYNDYIMVSPCRRYADTANVGGLLDIAASGLTAAEAYKYYPTAADLKDYRLNSPDVKLTIEYGNKKVELIASRYDDSYFAVIVTGKEDVIFKVANSFLPFAEFPDTAFANNLTFIEVISDFKKMTFKTASDTYAFDISYTEETEEEESVLEVSIGGKKITAQNFQNFYQHLVVECNEITLDRLRLTPTLTVTAERVEGGTTTVSFCKHNDRRYYVEVDSAPIGFISTTNMEKILTYLADVAADKEVPAVA